jgi:hypothetical protein
MQHRFLTDSGWLPNSVAQAFAPVHKTAMGVAVGLVCGLAIFGLTAFQLIAHPPDGPQLTLLKAYFHGYTITWTGAAVGMFWGFVTGFVGGWFAAFVRNFTLAVSLIALRAKANFANSFLDHI